MFIDKLSSEGMYWLGVWSLVSIVIMTLIISIATYNISKTNTIHELIEAGHSPIAANCAVNDDYGRNTTCILIATKLEKKLKN